ncbi:MAG: hypothetical protein ACJAZ9_000667 [Neolewinella sp.]|jgi:hypothetical protein
MLTIIYLLKVAAIQLIAYLGYLALLDKAPLGHLKRGYLLFSLGLSFIIPLCVVWRVDMMMGSERVLLHPETTTSEVTGELIGGFSWFILALLAVYILGLLVQFGKLGRFLFIIRRQIKEAVSMEKLAGATWFALPHAVPVHTFGRTIFYPETTELSEAIRLHELAHARQLHSLDRVAIALLRAVWWFNPILWLYERAIIQNHEFLADRAALSAGVSIREYTQQLMQSLTPVGRAHQLSSGLPFSFTKKRFTMLLSSSPDKGHTAGKVLLLGLLWAVLILGFGQTVYAQIPPPPPPQPPAAPSVQPPPPPPQPPAPPAPPTYPDVKNLPPPPPPPISPEMAAMSPKERIAHLLNLHKEKVAQTFTREQIKDYQDASKYGVWVDGRRIENKYLSTYSPESFFRHHKSKLMRNARHYGKYTYHLSLTTKAAHHRRGEELKRLLKEM